MPNKRIGPAAKESSIVGGHSAEAVREQLEKILGSLEFRKAPRLSAFLRYVVEQTLAGQSESIKGYTIAVDVFERPESFDPVTDTIVRVQAGKLRRALERHYSLQGTNDVIRIDIPKGAYVPSFLDNQNAGANEATPPEYTPDRTNQNRVVVCPRSPRPAVAVLPFRNLGGNEAREFFAEGLAEELSINLARFQDLTVIAYYSTRQFRDHTTGVGEAGKELGVDFVVTGSVRENAELVRVATQLSDTRTEEQLWAQSFDCRMAAESLFDVQDRIVQQVLAAVADAYGIISRQLAKDTQDKPITRLTAYEAILLFRHYFNVHTQENYIRAWKALEHAVEIDPDHALAWAMLANIYIDAYALGSADIENALGKGLEYSRKAIRLDPLDQFAQTVSAYCSLQERNSEGMARAAENALALNPNSAYTVGVVGWHIALAGNFERGLTLLERGVKLNPYYPGWFHLAPYLYHYGLQEYELALTEANSFGLPGLFWDPLVRAAALGQLGRKSSARAALKELLILRPNFCERARFFVSRFVIEDRLVEHILDGLHKAGLPRDS